jgi:hypothetical protein
MMEKGKEYEGGKTSSLLANMGESISKDRLLDVLRRIPLVSRYIMVYFLVPRLRPGLVKGLG